MYRLITTALSSALTWLFCILWSTQALSAEPYVSLGVGLSTTNGDIQPDPPLLNRFSQVLPAASHIPYARAAVGLSIDRLDLEIGTGRLARWQERTVSDGIGFNMTAGEVDLRARYWFLPGKFKLYAEGGIARVQWETAHWKYLAHPVQCDCARNGWPGDWFPNSGTSFSPQLGAGIGYEINRNWMVTAGATGTLDFNNFNTVQIGAGLRYNFK